MLTTVKPIDTFLAFPPFGPMVFHFVQATSPSGFLKLPDIPLPESYSNTNLKWPRRLFSAFKNISGVVWKENIWCALSVKPPFCTFYSPKLAASKYNLITRSRFLLSFASSFRWVTTLTSLMSSWMPSIISLASFTKNEFYWSVPTNLRSKFWSVFIVTWTESTRVCAPLPLI